VARLEEREAYDMETCVRKLWVRGLLSETERLKAMKRLKKRYGARGNNRP
jgi:hypothetical protein